MKRRAITIAIFSCLFMLCATARQASAQVFDIGSGGPPTITGAQGGSVSGSTSTLQDLVVTVDFGELSPINTNSLVKVVVPVAIRSTAPYQVRVSVAGSFDANLQAIQQSDIGFGVQNMRQMGSKAQDCTVAHLFRSPFNNDPSTGVTLDANGRAAYTSSLRNLGAATVVLSGPRLTRGSVTKHEADNGYIFDAIFTIKPQYYVTGSFSATITFNISAGPTVGC
ncbi:MAG TPA: hypothetical protein VF544_23650 [Pyrinomonadaceae bacterium]|jgi:hypothetical protein